MRRALAISLLMFGFASVALAQKLNVKIVNREDHDSSYDYAGVYTFGGSATAAATTFHVTGATLTLQLPDGRTAVVNCALSSLNISPVPQAIAAVAMSL